MNILVCTALISTFAMSPAWAGESDANLNSRVRAALYRDLGPGAGDIQVDSYGGTVQLSGSVESRAMWDGAATSAGEVHGVNHVLNVLQHGGEPRRPVQ